jgi:hypothetical protein
MPLISIHRGLKTLVGSVLACAAAVVSCSAPSKGALILAISTDMQTPKDLDVVSIYVETSGVPKYDFLGRVRPDGTLSLPSTLAVVEPDDPNAQVRIRVIAFQTQPSGDATARAVRDVLTTVPHERVVLLRVPLSFLDDGSAQGTLPKALVPDPAAGVSEGDTTYQPITALPSDPGYIKTSCDFTQGQTSIAGTCQSASLPSAPLPDYDDSEVFGDGGSASNPNCFDVDKCFTQASSVTAASITTAADGSCSFPVAPGENGQDWNCALATTDGTGTCFGGKCFVPLESDPGEGFSVDPGKALRMVAGVCKKLQAGAVLYVDKTSCATKVEASPVCEPDVQTGDGGFSPDATMQSDAATPSDATTQTDSGRDATVLPPVDAGPMDTALPDDAASVEDAASLSDAPLPDGGLACPSDLSSLSYVSTTGTTSAALPPFVEGAVYDGVYVLSSSITYESNGGCPDGDPDAGTAFDRGSLTVSSGMILVADQPQGQALQCQGPYPLAVFGYNVSADGQTITFSLGGSSCSSASMDGMAVEAGSSTTVGTYVLTGSADAGVSVGCRSATECPGGNVCCIDVQRIETCSASCDASQRQVCASSAECLGGLTCVGSGGSGTCSPSTDAAAGD